MMNKTALLCIFVAVAAVTPAWAGVEYTASGTPSDWRSRTIYQVLTDRFSGGSGSDLSNYCGGTFKGLEDKLDYITGMGFDAIWISPVVKNLNGGYHGYWATDLYDINENFGTKDDLKSLVDACHKRGVYVMVDVVANHMGPVGYDFSQLSPFNQAEHYHDCNSCPQSCNIEDFNNQNQVEVCRLAGLPDLNQSNGFVRDGLKKWIADLVSTYKFDGIRIDTVPEVPKDFWSEFTQSAGVFSIGEVFNGDINYVSPYQGPVNSVLSYPLYFTLRDVFQNHGSMYKIQEQLKAYSAFSDQSLLGTFVDNHDNPRFLNSQGDRVLYKNALLYVLTGMGIPIVYYGSEQGFAGSADPQNREVMWNSFDTSSDLYQFLATINKHRAVSKLASEPQVQRYADDTFYAFTRGDTFVALTNVGSGGEAVQRTITYNDYADGTVLCNIFNAGDCVTVSGKSFSIQLDGGMPKVYSPKDKARFGAFRATIA